MFEAQLNSGVTFTPASAGRAATLPIARWPIGSNRLTPCSSCSSLLTRPVCALARGVGCFFGEA
jgi:hypothetical protein